MLKRQSRRDWIAGLLCAGVLPAQEAKESAVREEGYRQIWDTAFRKKRPPNPRPGAAQAPPKPKYELASPEVKPLPEGVVIGLTIWRLRSPSATDTAAPRLLVYRDNSAQKSSLVAERVNSRVPLEVGDQVRLSVEVPQEGYLYLIDRELYRDGRRGAPYLLFPVLNVRNGNNRVRAGMLVDVPSQQDTPPALTLERHGEGHVGEELLILVSRQPLSEIEPDGEPRKLDESLVANWEKRWGKQASRLELDASQPGTWTKNEQLAGAGAGHLLTRDDPMPQLLLQSPSGPDSGVLLRYQLIVR